MDYTKAIDQLLGAIEADTGMTSAQISASINRGISYISSAKKGPNAEQCYNLLKAKYGHLLNEMIQDDQINLQAELDALREEFLLLKAQVQNRPVDDVQSELERKTALILNNLRRSKKK